MSTVQKTPRPTDDGRVVYRVARTPGDAAAVLDLRDAVYVGDQGRLADAGDMAATFDRFDRRATYLLAEDEHGAVGAIKIIPDSADGLPCEEYVSLDELRPERNLVEFGHLMTLPRVRNQAIGKTLMREALITSVTRHGATHVLGDFFIDDGLGLKQFYLSLGFEMVGEPYRDPRFQDSPLSAVAALDLGAAARRAHGAGASALLRYFFHDFHELTTDR